MTALVLGPGASATRDQPALVAIDREVSRLGIEVVRLDLPKRAEKAVVTLREVADGLAERHPAVLLGGRSFGGRVASMAAAAGFAAAGLVLVSYPLHPPGRPEQRRVEHLPAVTVPCLFVSGTRDAFATPNELEAATATVAGPVTHVWVEGGDHGLRGKDQEVAGAVARWVGSLRLPEAFS